jgi:uncharacterized protein YlxP (DUF503 family)
LNKSKYSIGVLCVNLFCGEAASLKDKRQIIRSLIAKLKNKYNIAVKEVDNEDKWQVATLGIVTIDKNEFMVHNTIENIMNYINNCHNLVVVDNFKEIL